MSLNMNFLDLNRIVETSIPICGIPSTSGVDFQFPSFYARWENALLFRNSGDKKYQMNALFENCEARFVWDFVLIFSSKVMKVLLRELCKIIIGNCENV